MSHAFIIKAMPDFAISKTTNFHISSDAETVDLRQEIPKYVSAIIKTTIYVLAVKKF